MSEDLPNKRFPGNAQKQRSAKCAKFMELLQNDAIPLIPGDCAIAEEADTRIKHDFLRSNSGKDQALQRSFQCCLHNRDRISRCTCIVGIGHQNNSLVRCGNTCYGRIMRQTTHIIKNGSAC